MARPSDVTSVSCVDMAMKIRPGRNLSNPLYPSQEDHTNLSTYSLHLRGLFYIMLQWVNHSIPERTKRLSRGNDVTEARGLEAENGRLSQPSGASDSSRQKIEAAGSSEKSPLRRSSEPQTDTADTQSRGSRDITPPVRAESTPPAVAATEYQGISQASKLGSGGPSGSQHKSTADSESQGADIKTPTFPIPQDDGLLLTSSSGKGKEAASGKPGSQINPPHNHTHPSQAEPIAPNSSPEDFAQGSQGSETGGQPLDREGIRQALLAKIGVKPGETVEYTVHHRDAIVHEEVFPQTHTIYQPTRTYDIHIHEHRKVYQPLLDTEAEQEQEDYYVHSEY